MPKPVLSVFFALILLNCLQGCIKRHNNGGTFTIRGQWLKDCSGTAHANELLEINLVRYGLNSKETFDNVGSGMTDAEGRFSIVCENHGNADLSIKGAETGIGDLYVTGGDGKIDDLGTLYDQYTASATLKFVFTKSSTDTFFLTDGVLRDTFSFYPATGTHFIPLSKTGHWKPNRIFQGHYGLGRADFVRPVNSGDPRIIEIENAYSICSPGDTAVVQIP